MTLLPLMMLSFCQRRYWRMCKPCMTVFLYVNPTFAAPVPTCQTTCISLSCSSMNAWIGSRHPYELLSMLTPLSSLRVTACKKGTMHLFASHGDAFHIPISKCKLCDACSGHMALTSSLGCTPGSRAWVAGVRRGPPRPCWQTSTRTLLLRYLPPELGILSGTACPVPCLGPPAQIQAMLPHASSTYRAARPACCCKHFQASARVRCLIRQWTAPVISSDQEAMLSALCSALT